MSQLEAGATTIDAERTDPEGTDFFGDASAADVAALLDPTAAGKALVEGEAEDWCAFGEA